MLRNTSKKVGLSPEPITQASGHLRNHKASVECTWSEEVRLVVIKHRMGLATNKLHRIFASKSRQKEIAEMEQRKEEE